MISRMPNVLRLGAALLACIASIIDGSSYFGSADAQGIRDRTRPRPRADRAAATVAEQQAAEITLTVAPVGEQLLQTWIRTAGVIDEARKVLRACVADEDAALIVAGQRVRAFAPETKASMSQARITSLAPRGDCIAIEATLSGPVYSDATRYVMEIIVDRGSRFAVANAAIIERDGKQIVYEEIHPGHYEPHEIRTGIKGEIYTEVLDGIAEGYRIITIGSFFIDAEYRLKMTPGNGMDAHHHH
jgi:hypothetical protein